MLNPSESDVKVGTKIVIEGLADDEKAYYTLNGSTPSANSSQYSGGITLDKAGNYTMSFNSEWMYRGTIGNDGKPVVAIYR